MRLLPQLTPENTPFWTGGESGDLLITCCDSCDSAVHPPELVCPACLSDMVTPRKAAGTGTIYSFTVNHQPWLPGMKVPFAIAVVDLDGMPGVRVTAEVADSEVDAVAIGGKVEFTFLHVEDVWIPQVRLIA